jgi:hypothetical protein
MGLGTLTKGMLPSSILPKTQLQLQVSLKKGSDGITFLLKTPQLLLSWRVAAKLLSLVFKAPYNMVQTFILILHTLHMLPYSLANLDNLLCPKCIQIFSYGSLHVLFMRVYILKSPPHHLKISHIL